VVESTEDEEDKQRFKIASTVIGDFFVILRICVLCLKFPKKLLRSHARFATLAAVRLLVGGCVRDAVDGPQPPKTGTSKSTIDAARLREVLDQFGPVNVVGEAFTVYKLGQHLDVSIPRRERKSGRGHKAFVIEGDPAMSVEEATRRRDFTINAILQDPLTGELIDPFHGQRISSGVLRAVSRRRLRR
jgi:tRNA nucleotidyltransferase (CCA-adding enzyme)